MTDAPAEPTPDAATTLPARTCDNVAIAAAIAIGRPTPSPEPFEESPPAASNSPADSDAAGSPAATRGDVAIGGRAPDDGARDAARHDDGDADAAFFATPPPPFEEEATALEDEDALVEEGYATARDLAAAAAAAVATASSPGGDGLPPLPPLGPAATPGPLADTPAGFSGFNFRNDGLLYGSPLRSSRDAAIDGEIRDSPERDAALDAACAVDDPELVGREMTAAASTASAMLSRTDGFHCEKHADGTSGPAETLQAPGGGARDDASRRFYARYAPLDEFPLPPDIQAHLDDTYAALDVGRPHNPDGHTWSDGHVFFRVTHFRRHDGGEAAAGTARPAATASRAASAEKNRKQKQNGAKARPRPLPLRKRQLRIHPESDGEDYSPAFSAPVMPDGKRRNLVRHNVRSVSGAVTCKCSKSRCLKLYCDCFQAGKMCSAACQCKNCKNTEEHDRPGGLRRRAVEETLLRRPDAFEPRTRNADEGCRCKKNRCLKKYCICFNQGVKCDDRCRCINCENQPTSEDAREDAVAGGMAAFASPTQFMDVKLEPVPESVESAHVPSLFAGTPPTPKGYGFYVAGEMEAEMDRAYEEVCQV